jgi:hypothetical protein
MVLRQVVSSVAVRAALVAGVLVPLASCDGSGPAVDAGAIDASTRSICASAIEGCGCTIEGQTQECFPDPLAENGASVCLVGERTCAGGTWGACEDVRRLVGEDGRDVVVQAASDDPFACSPCEPLCFQARDFIEGDQDIMERGGNGIVFNPGRGGAENVGRVTECRDASCGTRSTVGYSSSAVAASLTSFSNAVSASCPVTTLSCFANAAVPLAVCSNAASPFAGSGFNGAAAPGVVTFLTSAATNGVLGFGAASAACSFTMTSGLNPGGDFIQIDLGVPVFGIVEIQESVPLDQPDTHRADRILEDLLERGKGLGFGFARSRLTQGLLGQPIESIDHGHKSAVDRGGAGAPIGFDHIAIEPQATLAERLQVDNRAQGAAD